jgi:hypothetical protein
VVVDELFFLVVVVELFFDEPEFFAVVVVFDFGPFALLTSPADVVLPFGEDVVFVVLVVFVVFGADALFAFGAASMFTERAAAATSATGSAIHLLIRMDTCLLAEQSSKQHALYRNGIVTCK